MMSLSGKTAIISGATRGIGKAIALELARQGCRISFNYLKSADEAQAVIREIEGLGSVAQSFQVDIKDFNAVTAWVNKTKEAFGGLDIVINNAGIIRDKALAMMLQEDWMDVITTNLLGTINLSRAAIMTLVKQKSGQIVNISSVTGVVGMPRQTNYAASKAGIIGFTKALAKETAAYGIRVNAVAPGFIETDMVAGLKDDFKTKMTARIPLGRFGKPEDVAQAVSFLVSERAGYITGQVIVMDGGLSIS